MPKVNVAKVLEVKHSEHTYTPLFWRSWFQNIQVLEILASGIRPKTEEKSHFKSLALK